MKKIFLIDPLEKLNYKKDRSLLWALTAQARGEECFLLFKNELFIQNMTSPNFICHKFSGSLVADGFYLASFNLQEEMKISLSVGDTIVMRLDPPFDSSYLRSLWLLRCLELQGIRVINSPAGISQYNEKVLPLAFKDYAISTVIGSTLQVFLDFMDSHKDGVNDFIIKPLDLFQGLGVQRISKKSPDLKNLLLRGLESCSGTMVMQPFNMAIYQGEIRSLFFKSKELGTIIKRPPPGSFLANIAQGAKYEIAELDLELKDKCIKLCDLLGQQGVDLVAFDLLGGKISEVNITCPGLLVEVSTATGKNLTQELN